MPTNMADVAKRPGAARQAAADRDARPAVTLTPAEVRAVERALGAKAQHHKPGLLFRLLELQPILVGQGQVLRTKPTKKVDA
jgi:hypothetical protein